MNFKPYTQFFYIILMLVLPWNSNAQDSLKRKPRLSGLPAGFYTPETGIGGGGVAVLTFNWKKDTLRTFPSSLTLGAVYTQNKQILVFLPYTIYLKNRDYWLYGEIGYYKYYYHFFGIGNNIAHDFRETYSASFSRFRFSGMKRISKKKYLYTGIKYAYDKINMLEIDANGKLYNENIPGSKGGTISGFGWVSSYDTRNHPFYPTKGQLIEFFVYGENKFTGSSFQYTRATMDASAFFTLSPKQVLGLNFYGTWINGTVPFTHLGLLGGSERLRGYYEGRYRDKVALTWQAEWRCKLFWRFGMNIFASTGVVAPDMQHVALNKFRYSAGIGGRFTLDKKQGMNLRADFALGHNSHGVYFTIAEAF